MSMLSDHPCDSTFACCLKISARAGDEMQGDGKCDEKRSERENVASTECCLGTRHPLHTFVLFRESKLVI